MHLLSWIVRKTSNEFFLSVVPQQNQFEKFTKKNNIYLNKEYYIFYNMILNMFNVYKDVYKETSITMLI